MTRIELKTAAKEQISGKIGILFVMMLIVGILGVACIYTGNRNNWSNNYNTSI